MENSIFAEQQASVYPEIEDLNGMTQETSVYKNRIVHILNPKKPTHKHLIYLHGGGYYCGYGLRHWRMISHIGIEANVTVHCLEYPLIPFTCEDAIGYVKSYYLELLQEVSEKNIYFIGDSAGAGLAISTIMTLRNESAPLPRFNFMYSPYVDVTFSHPYFDKISSHDETLYKVGEIYSGKYDMKDYRVSPVYGNMNDLCPTLIVTNSGDRLSHDTLIMVDKFKDSNSIHEFMYFEGLYHDFVLDLYLDESKEVHGRIIELIDS